MAKRVFVGIILLFSLAVPLLTKDPYQLHVLITMFITVILVLGFLVVWVTGRLHFGVAGMWAIGAYTSALIVMKLGLSFWIALPLAGVITAIVGLSIGHLICKTTGGTFIMLTWAFAEIVRLTIVTETRFLGGSAGIMNIPTPNPISIFGSVIKFTSKVPYYYLILFLLLINVLFLYRLYNSHIGRILRAIGQSDNVSQSIGVYLLRYRVLAYIICSFFAGLAGSFYAHYLIYLCPDQFTLWESLTVEVYAVVGGVANFIAGPIAGTCFLIFLLELFRGTKAWVPVIYGIAIIAVIFFLPEGLASLPRVIRKKQIKLVRRGTHGIP
jgi:branched-chain amino acid transport system permease protein